MRDVKDTLRALVRISYDGRVFKTFRGPKAEERFANEVRVLRYLEKRGCGFVPRLLEVHPEQLQIVTTNCGARVEHLDEARVRELFEELIPYGVRHDDAEMRNVTYRQSDGRFCLIDFEFATILAESDKTPMQPPRDISPAPRLRWSGLSDRGKVRKNNEDSFLGMQFDAQEAHLLGKLGEASLENVDLAFAVSDGMGGAMAGEFASRITVEKITRLLPRAFKQTASGMASGFGDVLAELFAQIHRAMSYLGESYEECRGMGATLSLCWFTPGWMYFAHVGDSRIYYLPAEGGMKQVSEDDTYVGWLLRNGKLTEYEARNHPARNRLQKALGGGNQFVDPQVGAVAFEKGDTFVLTTDGVMDGLFDNAIADCIRTPDALDPAQRLVHAAVEQSGRDNTTAVVVEVL